MQSNIIGREQQEQSHLMNNAQKYRVLGERADMAEASENSNVLSMSAPLHLMPHHQ